MAETPMKRCSRGDECVHEMGCWQPETSEFFSPRSDRPGAFYNKCRACDRAYHQTRRAENPEQTKVINRRSYAKHADERCAKIRQHRAEHGDQVRERDRRRIAENPERFRAKRQRHYARRGDHIRERERQRYIMNGDHIRERQRQRRAEHGDQVRERQRQHYSERRDIMRQRDRNRSQNPNRRIQQYAARQRRRARKRGLPDTLTTADWQRSVTYFGSCCAVCGRAPSGNITLAADHWIPLTKGGATIPTNILPLCHGLGGCNNHKYNRDPLEFLNSTFGADRAAEILARIENYFAWVRQQEG